MRIYRTATERIQSNQESKYIQAKHISAQSNVAAALTRQAAILEAGKIACENAKSMSERILEGKRAARNMRTEIQTSVVEFSQPVLDKLNETLKTKQEKIQIRMLIIIKTKRKKMKEWIMVRNKFQAPLKIRNMKTVMLKTIRTQRKIAHQLLPDNK